MSGGIDGASYGLLSVKVAHAGEREECAFVPMQGAGKHRTWSVPVDEAGDDDQQPGTQRCGGEFAQRPVQTLGLIWGRRPDHRGRLRSHLAQPYLARLQMLLSGYWRAVSGRALAIPAAGALSAAEIGDQLVYQGLR